MLEALTGMGAKLKPTTTARGDGTSPYTCPNDVPSQAAIETKFSGTGAIDALNLSDRRDLVGVYVDLNCAVQ